MGQVEQHLLTFIRQRDSGPAFDSLDANHAAQPKDNPIPKLLVGSDPAASPRSSRRRLGFGLDRTSPSRCAFPWLAVWQAAALALGARGG